MHLSNSAGAKNRGKKMTNNNKTKPSLEEVLKQITPYIKKITTKMIDTCNLVESDLPDLEQEMVIAVWQSYEKYNYDPVERPVVPYFIQVIDNKRKEIYRHRNAAKRRILDAGKVLHIVDDPEDDEDAVLPEHTIYLSNVSEVVDTTNELDRLFVAMDLHHLIETRLTPQERAIINALSNASCREEAARSISMPSSSYYRALKNIQKKLPELGEIL